MLQKNLHSIFRLGENFEKVISLENAESQLKMRF